jgi:hypothetical protein
MLNSKDGTEWIWDGHRTYSDLSTIVTKDGEISELCKKIFDFSEPTEMSHTNLKSIPYELQCYYDDDLDLVEIHNIVRGKIILLNRMIKEYDLQLSILQSKITDLKLPPIDISYNYRKTVEIIELKNKFLQGSYWVKYCNLVIPILNKYSILILSDLSCLTESLGKIGKEEKIECILKYVECIREIENFLDIKISKKITSSFCPACSGEIKSEFSMGDDKYYCSCGFVENSINHITEYNDINKTIPQINSTIVNIAAFKIWLDRFLCKSGDTYPKEEMFLKFDEYCLKNNFPPRKKVIERLIPQPDMKIIIYLLQNTGFSKYYKIKFIIRKDYYGYEKVSITNTQEKLAEKLYIDIQTQYSLFKQRKTNINMEILGYIILYLVGIEVNIEDFKIPPSEETIEYSNSILKKILLKLGYEESQIPRVYGF